MNKYGVKNGRIMSKYAHKLGGWEEVGRQVRASRYAVRIPYVLEARGNWMVCMIQLGRNEIGG